MPEIAFASVSSSITSASIKITARKVADSFNEYIVPQGVRTSWAMDYTELVGRWAMEGSDPNLSLSFILSCLTMDSIIKSDLIDVEGPSVMRVN